MFFMLQRLTNAPPSQANEYISAPLYPLIRLSILTTVRFFVRTISFPPSGPSLTISLPFILPLVSVPASARSFLSSSKKLSYPP